MIAALNNIRVPSLPFFQEYAEFFTKHFNLKKFPLAVKNIVVVEEFIQSKDQYYIESWVDSDGVCSTFSSAVDVFVTRKKTSSQYM